MSKHDNNFAIAPTETPAVDNPVDNPAMMPGKNGGWLKRGGVNPGSGRPPDAWKEACRKLASNNEILKTARRILRDPDHPAWIGAWKFVAEHGYGKPVESKEVRRRNELVIRVVREGENG